MPDANGRSAEPAGPGTPLPNRFLWLVPWLLGVTVFFAVERTRLAEAGILNWFLQSDLDTLAYLAFLVLAPGAWWCRRKRTRTSDHVQSWRIQFIDWFLKPSSDDPAPARGRLIAISLFLGLASLLASAAVGARFGSLPPAYHDEYSYVFQAQTFLAGRISHPSHPAARLFDQMHVLNEGRFASRYFPGTGLWMAPFVALGHPYWGHWMAGAICSILMFWIGRELAGEGAGIIAGVLTAFSPAMALFSNLLLAHHPTLVGLSLFLLGFLRMVRSERKFWAILSGIGLAFAMLCRPMTAVGVAFPFGAYLIAWIFRGGWESSNGLPVVAGCEPPGNIGYDSASGTSRMRRLLSLRCLGMPLACAGVGLFFYDQSITGSGWLTPYSMYTDLHTPRHVYGFNNVERGKLRAGPRVIKNYDDWAENLTPTLAALNAGTRIVASAKWTLGLLPIALALAGGIVLGRRLGTGAWLVLSGIVSLHAAHIPYWFVGMEDHHYVFEAGSLWSVWVAVVTISAFRVWQSERPLLIGWWISLVGSAVVLNWTVSSGIWSAPLEQGIGRVKFARTEHRRFEQLVNERAVPAPALVLVDADPSDRHIDYVNNTPDLKGPVLIGRFVPEQVSLDEVARIFADRRVFVYRIRNVFENGRRFREEEWTPVESR